MTYRADSLVLDFLKLAQDGNPMFSVIGELEWKCQDIGPGNPLAFKSEDNYMVRKPPSTFFIPPRAGDPKDVNIEEHLPTPMNNEWRSLLDLKSPLIQ